MATKQNMQVPRLGELLYMGKGSQREKRAWLADKANVDETTITRWIKGQEPIPDDVIAWLADIFAVSVPWLMRWEDAPKNTIPAHWRKTIAENTAAHCEERILQECQGLLHSIEERLAAEQDLDISSLEVPRLQRLRTALLEWLAEPLDDIA